MNTFDKWLYKAGVLAGTVFWIVYLVQREWAPATFYFLVSMLAEWRLVRGGEWK